ncbi:MAG: hypothetical protein QG619_873 [Pseudomonadota bacterium]|nr:hypothetical protein [Pseudomonadota bacterium]
MRNDPLKDDPWLLKPAVAQAFGGVTTRSVDNWVKSGRLPPPDRLPNGRPAWRESVIRNAVKSAT